jgi:hypothetical protein
MNRIIAGTILLISILFGYWWITWILAIILLFTFPVYYEIIICGIIYDSLYGISSIRFMGIEYVFTIFSIVLFLFSLLLTKHLKIYEY